MISLDTEGIRGWFPYEDQLLFDWLLHRQTAAGISGNLVEIGVYLGKTAIFLGGYLRDGEHLTVCDLFEMPASDSENQREKDDYAHYGDNVTKDEFLRNYGSFHSIEPKVVQGDSGGITDHVEPGSCRFVHVDASHLYQHVRVDISSTQTMLGKAGVVAIDDYRARHSPGVGAAVWEAVLLRGLKPAFLTERKFYGTWGDADALRSDLLAWLEDASDFDADIQDVAGHPLVRVVRRAKV